MNRLRQHPILTLAVVAGLVLAWATLRVWQRETGLLAS